MSQKYYITSETSECWKAFKPYKTPKRYIRKEYIQRQVDRCYQSLQQLYWENYANECLKAAPKPKKYA